MREKQVTRTVYVTADGREYPSKRNAIKHEKELAQNLDPQLLAIVLSEKCNAKQDAGGCENCPLFRGYEECVLNESPSWEWKNKIS